MRRSFEKRLRGFDPDRLGTLSRLGLYARQVVEGFIAGQHASDTMGWNVEFADYREYVPGDDLRTLDWRVYGRTDRFYVRRYEEETSMRVYFVIDTSASMGFAWEGQSKIDTAAHIAAALGYLLVRQRDGVGLLSFGEKLTLHLPPAGTPAHLRQFWQHLEGLEPGGQTRVGPALRDLAARARRRGLVILLSDVLYDLDELTHGLALFTHRKFDLILIQILTPAEQEFPYRGDHRFRDIEGDVSLTVTAGAVRHAYLLSFGAHQQRLRGECARMGIDYFVHRTDAVVEPTLGAFLARRRALPRG